MLYKFLLLLFKEGSKEGRKEERKEGMKEEWKEGRKEVVCLSTVSTRMVIQ